MRTWCTAQGARSFSSFQQTSFLVLSYNFRFFQKSSWKNSSFSLRVWAFWPLLIKLIFSQATASVSLCLFFPCSWWKLEFSFGRGVDLSSDCTLELPLYSPALLARHWGLNGEPALDKHEHTWHSFLASWPPLQTSHIPAVWRQGSAARAKQHHLSQRSFHLGWEDKSGLEARDPTVGIPEDWLHEQAASTYK